MKNSSKHPKATHKGELRLGDTILECFVLKTGERVLSRAGMLKALGAGNRSSVNGVAKLPVFAAAENLQPFLGQGFAGVAKLIEFRAPSKRW